MTEELLSKSGTKGKVWDYFGLQKGADGKPLNDRSAVCRICCACVKAKYGNTSNLMSHLKTNHPSLYQEVIKSGKTPRYKSTTLLLAAQPSPPYKKALNMLRNMKERIKSGRNSQVKLHIVLAWIASLSMLLNKLALRR